MTMYALVLVLLLFRGAHSQLQEEQPTGDGVKQSKLLPLHYHDCIPTTTMRMHACMKQRLSE